MGGIFGKSNKKAITSRVTEQDKAVLQLKSQRDKLKQYQKRIELSLVKDREIARKCLQSGRKERAKLLLRKKKYQEKLLENTDTQLENLEKLASDLEFAQIEQQVLDGLKVGNTALKKVHDLLSIDEIESIMEETAEGVEKQREIDSILTGVLTDQDEEDVLAELDALIGTEDKSIPLKLPEVPKDIVESLPDVPEDSLPEKEKTLNKKVLVEA
ncbi:CHMP6 family protein [Megaselia abdita]